MAYKQAESSKLTVHLHEHECIGIWGQREGAIMQANLQALPQTWLSAGLPLSRCFGHNFCRRRFCKSTIAMGTPCSWQEKCCKRPADCIGACKSHTDAHRTLHAMLTNLLTQSSVLSMAPQESCP